MHILHFLFLILIKKILYYCKQSTTDKMHCRTLIKRNHSEYLSAKSVTADNISNKKQIVLTVIFSEKKEKKKKDSKCTS